jgi:hippurate hydrolase
MQSTIRTLADEVYPEIVELRRTLHRHPELAFEERETAATITEELQDLPLQVHTGIATTGIIAVLDGDRPGPTISLRADMDALPIQEENDLPFASEQSGVMHACGHDAHSASLLGAAIILSRIRDDLPGTIRFIFQPSEERLPGGAKIMMEERALKPLNGTPAPETIFGQHVMPELPAGHIGLRGGMYMASTDEIHVTIHGEGGHGAMPHRLEADPVVVASHIVLALQNIISRNCPPNIPSVLTIGKITAPGATNVIPETAHLEGTFRAMDEEWRFRAHKLIRRAIEHTARAYGATCDIELPVGYPALYNDPGLTDYVRETAVQYVGDDRTVDLDQWYASEDFAFYLREIPGVFYRLGVRNEAEGIVHDLHTPRFDIDEEALRTGAGFMAYLAWRYLSDHAS